MSIQSHPNCSDGYFVKGFQRKGWMSFYVYFVFIGQISNDKDRYVSMCFHETNIECIWFVHCVVEYNHSLKPGFSRFHLVIIFCSNALICLQYLYNKRPSSSSNMYIELHQILSIYLITYILIQKVFRKKFTLLNSLLVSCTFLGTASVYQRIEGM